MRHDLDELDRLNTAGDRYGHITPGVVAELIAEVRRLRADAERYQMLCAASYQMAGVANAPVRFLDALSDAANGELEARAKTDALLPIDPSEAGCFPAWSDAEVEGWKVDTERLAWWFRFDPPKDADFVNVYLKGMAQRWNLDQWRAAIDAARKEKA